MKAAKESVEVNPKEPEALLVGSERRWSTRIVRSSNGAVPFESKFRKHSARPINIPG